MFEDDEDEDDDFVRSEFEMWFDDHVFFFPPELRSGGFDNLEIECFYNNVYCNVKREIAEPLRQLGYKFFPKIGAEVRPKVVERFDYFIETTGRKLLLFLFELLYDEKNGVNLREKYPDFEGLIDFYAKPPLEEPNYAEILESSRHNFLTYEQVTAIFEKRRKLIYDRHHFEYDFRKGFVDIVQPILFKYYTELLNLNPDGWIIYSVHLREEYETFKMRCEFIDEFIELEFDEDYMDLDIKDYQEKVSEIRRKKYSLPRPDYAPGETDWD